MKRIMMTMLAVALMLTTATAQEKPQVLGGSHALLRVEVKNKYLLLPVQEREDNANIRVLAGGGR